MRFTVSEGFQHLDGNLIDCAGFMKDLAEHGAQRHHDRQKTQRAAHSFFHGRRNLIERHTGKKPCTKRHHHQSNEGVHTRLHH